jgi:transposase-like protein
MYVQAIGCFSCGTAEKISEDSPRLKRENGPSKWPAWNPGLQEFPCPNCGKTTVWATEPRLKED